MAHEASNRPVLCEAVPSEHGPFPGSLFLNSAHGKVMLKFLIHKFLED